jgi:type I restriction enzyme S subunit
MIEYNNEFIEFPKDWDVRRLNEIAELQRGLSYSSKEKSKDENPDGYLFLTLDSIKEGGGLKEDGWTWIKSDRLKERHFVKEGDIVIANTDIGMQRGHILGAPAIVHFPKWYKKDKAVFSMDLSKLLLRISNMDVNFLFYYLSFVQPLARKYHTGTGVWHLNLDSWARDLLIPLPSLEEQKRIVEILNTVDSIIIDTTNLIEKLKLLKEKTLNLLITGKIWHKEFKDTEIGKIPKNWEIVKLEEITTKIADIDHKMPKKQKNGIPFVSIKCMLKYPDLNFYLDLNDPDLEFISKEDYEYYARRFNVEKGDIIYSRFGSIGQAKLVTTEQPFIASYSIVLIKPYTHKVNSAFLTYILNSEVVVKQAKIATKGSANKNLHLRDIKNLKIPLPPLEEQKKIVEILSTIDKKIETETKYLDYMKKLKEKLLAALMTGKIRVNSITIGNLK